MEKFTTFEDLEVWKKGMRLSVKAYQTDAKLQRFCF